MEFENKIRNEQEIDSEENESQEYDLERDQLEVMQRILYKIDWEGTEYYYKYYDFVPVCYKCYLNAIEVMEEQIEEWNKTNPNDEISGNVDLDNQIFLDIRNDHYDPTENPPRFCADCQREHIIIGSESDSEVSEKDVKSGSNSESENETEIQT